MIVANCSLNINQIVKDLENTGRVGLALILSNVTNKAKDYQSLFMNVQNHSIKIVDPDTILNKLVRSGLACTTRKASCQKQSP
jgi:hypothetical protein